LFTKSEVTLAYVYLSKVNCARDFRQLSTLAANICEMDKWIKISTTGNKLDWLPSLPHWAKKFG